MKAGLVTVQEGEGGFGGEVLEGIGYTIEGIWGSLGSGLIFEQPGFDGPGAAQAPVRSDHLLDHAQLHAIGGADASDVFGDDGRETFGRFIAHDDLFREQAVAEGILRRTLFALGGKWTLGAGAIGP